jgi:hypothetical protein
MSVCTAGDVANASKADSITESFERELRLSENEASLDRVYNQWRASATYNPLCGN